MMTTFPWLTYSNKGGTRSLGVGTFDIPGIGRSPRVRRRRRKIGRIIVGMLGGGGCRYCAQSLALRWFVSEHSAFSCDKQGRLL